MSIKAGQILHAMNQFVVDRIQTAGAGNLNIPTEKIYELGNYQSVAVVRDIPDLTFGLDCLDVDTEVEAILTGSVNPSADPIGTDGLTGTKYSLANAVPVDIVSPMKSAQGAFDIVKGVAIPHLTLESASYRYGLRENAGENFSLRGDSIFYVPGTPYVQTETGTGVQSTFAFGTDGAGSTPTTTALTALLYVEQGQNIFALNVSVDGVRATRGIDYTDTPSGVTFMVAPAAGAKIRMTFGSNTPVSFDQTVHQGISVKPAAIRGKDIQVYVWKPATVGATPVPAAAFRWSDVQSFNVDYRVTIEDDFEFGNVRAVSREYADAPAVTGSIELKPLSTKAFFDKLQQITGVPASEIIGPQSSVSLPIEVRLLNPDSGGQSNVAPGTVLKTLYIPDARFTIPGYEGRAQQKMVATMNFESDAGILEIFKGKRF